MGNYILCRRKRTTNAYYIESISAHIFSIEELCFFIYHNIYLLDDTIINSKLCDWIKEDLGFNTLGMKLLSRLKGDIDIEAFILPIFKEINYLSHEEYKSLGIKLEQLDEQPELVKEKLKGDCLIRYGKYSNGIKVYQRILSAKQEDNLGGQFRGTIYHNMGCAYARLFQMEEAIVCLKKACELLHTRAAIKSYLSIIYIAKSAEEFTKEAIRIGVDEQTKEDILTEIKQSEDSEISSQSYQTFKHAQAEKAQGNDRKYYQEMNLLLENMTKEYHNNSGL